MSSKYWYKKVIFGCPICGYKYVKKVRVYGKKPLNPIDRIERVPVFDFCDKEY